MNVLVVGAGEMGRWIAQTLSADVAITDTDPAIASQSGDVVGAQVVPLDPANDEDSTTYDVGIFAVPMGAIDDAIARQADRIGHGVVDVTGWMAPAIAAMETYAPDAQHCSLHPLFAPERAPGSIAVVDASPGPHTAAILADLEAAGNELVETTTAEHDRAMESVQGAAHAAILSFALAADRVRPELETPVYAGLREQVERILAGSPSVYAEIQAAFDGADAVARDAAQIADADPEELEAMLTSLSSEWTGRPEEGDRDEDRVGDGKDDRVGSGKENRDEDRVGAGEEDREELDG